jgi:hypothetical protein
MILDRSVAGEELLAVYEIFKSFFDFELMLTETQTFREKKSSDGRGEMLF